jgi:hypothetical protein
MKSILNKLLILCLLAATASAADVTYTILTISETRADEYILVDKAWRKDTPKRLSVKLRASEEVSAATVVAKAYFYDADKKLIHTYAFPNKVWMNTKKGFEEVGLPPVLKKSDVNEVYFALTPELLKKNPKTTLIVFGDKSSVTVKSRNEVDLMDFPFPEKSKVKK